MSSGPGTAYAIIKGSNYADSRIKGNGDECYLFGDASNNGHAFLAAAAAFRSGVCDVRHCDRLSLQLVTDYATSAPVVIGASDTSVVASTKTFTIPGYDFTGQVGATINISGDVAHVGNNGAFVVSTVTSAHVVICTTASGLSNETFNPATTTITVTRTDAPLTGSWKVEVSNNFTPASTGTAYGQVASESGKWTDITSLFLPAIIADTGTGASTNQYSQLEFAARSMRVTFTPTP